METTEFTVNYLSSYSEKDSSWDKHRAVVDTITDYYRDTDLDKLAKRTYSCSRVLTFSQSTGQDGKAKLKLQRVFMCHCRLCTICMWSRTRVLRRRFLISLPQIIKYNPTARFLFLTLTVRNCPIDELNKTIKDMTKAFAKLMDRRSVKRVVLGYARSLEVTKSHDGTAHPHMHILLMVKPAYFSREYINQEEWAKLWQESLKVEYSPVVDIRAVKPKKQKVKQIVGDRTNDLPDLGDHAGLIDAVLEVSKYSCKPSDLVGAPKDKDGNYLKYTGELSHKEWFLELTRQLHGTKHLVCGGIFRQYMTDEEPEPEEILEAFNEEEDEEEND